MRDVSTFEEICTYYRAKGDALTVDLEAVARFDLDINNAIESASDQRLKLALSEIKYSAKKRLFQH